MWAWVYLYRKDKSILGDAGLEEYQNLFPS